MNDDGSVGQSYGRLITAGALNSRSFPISAYLSIAGHHWYECLFYVRPQCRGRWLPGGRGEGAVFFWTRRLPTLRQSERRLEDHIQRPGLMPITNDMEYLSWRSRR